jgi:hypothetical protein
VAHGEPHDVISQKIIIIKKHIVIQIKWRKWRWIGHTLRKPGGSIEKSALDWNPKGSRRRRRSGRHGRGWAR